MSLLYVDNDGGRLAVEVRGGAAAAPLVVCSPGLGDTRHAYGPLADQLVAAGCRVALVDLRGQGDASTGFASYGDEETARDYLAVVAALQQQQQQPIRDAPAVLAGASMSAAAATIAAARRPDLVAGVVLLGPYLRNGAGAVVRALLGVALWRPWGPWAWARFAASLWPGLGDGPGPQGRRGRAAASAARLAASSDRWAAFHAVVSVDHDRAVGPWLAEVRRRRVPALVVMGEQDPDWPKPLDEAAWVASQFAAATTLVVPGAGHAPMLESPAVVGPAVARFVDELRARGAFRPAGARE